MEKYVNLGLISQGSQGTCIFKARYKKVDDEESQLFAIKRVPILSKSFKIFNKNVKNRMKTEKEKEEKEDNEILLSQITEVNILEKLNHNQVIKYYESFIEENYFYIVMEFAVKGDLSKLIFSSKVSKKEEKKEEKKEVENYSIKTEEGYATKQSKKNLKNFIEEYIEGRITEKELDSLIELNKADKTQKNGGVSWFSNSYFQMKFIEEEILLKFLKQLSQGINYLHLSKILHRDIKPHNLFLFEDDLVKIGDFGISKILVNTIDFAESSTGTPYFLSPEICLGEKYNYKSDIWMLGCTLFELATLTKPFNSNTLINLMKVILTKNISFNIIEKIGYSRGLRKVIELCLMKDAIDRPIASEIMEIYNKENNPLIINSNLESLMSRCDKIISLSKTSNTSNLNKIQSSMKFNQLLNEGILSKKVKKDDDSKVNSEKKKENNEPEKEKEKNVLSIIRSYSSIAENEKNDDFKLKSKYKSSNNLAIISDYSKEKEKESKKQEPLNFLKFYQLKSKSKDKVKEVSEKTSSPKIRTKTKSNTTSIVNDKKEIKLVKKFSKKDVFMNKNEEATTETLPSTKRKMSFSSISAISETSKLFKQSKPNSRNSSICFINVNSISVRKLSEREDNEKKNVEKERVVTPCTNKTKNIVSSHLNLIKQKKKKLILNIENSIEKQENKTELKLNKSNKSKKPPTPSQITPTTINNSTLTVSNISKILNKTSINTKNDERNYTEGLDLNRNLFNKHTVKIIGCSAQKEEENKEKKENIENLKFKNFPNKNTLNKKLNTRYFPDSEKKIKENAPPKIPKKFPESTKNESLFNKEEKKKTEFLDFNFSKFSENNCYFESKKTKPSNEVELNSISNISNNNINSASLNNSKIFLNKESRNKNNNKIVKEKDERNEKGNKKLSIKNKLLGELNSSNISSISIDLKKNSYDFYCYKSTTKNNRYKNIIKNYNKNQVNQLTDSSLFESLIIDNNKSNRSYLHTEAAKNESEINYNLFSLNFNKERPFQVNNTSNLRIKSTNTNTKVFQSLEEDEEKTKKNNNHKNNKIQRITKEEASAQPSNKSTSNYFTFGKKQPLKEKTLNNLNDSKQREKENENEKQKVVEEKNLIKEIKEIVNTNEINELNSIKATTATTNKSKNKNMSKNKEETEIKLNLSSNPLNLNIENHNLNSIKNSLHTTKNKKNLIRYRYNCVEDE